MKKLLVRAGIVISIITLVGAMSITVFAADTSTTAETSKDSTTSSLSRSQHKHGKKQPLTDEQKTEIQATHEAKKAELDALTDEEKAEVKAEREEQKEYLKSLTPEQRKEAIGNMDDGIFFGALRHNFKKDNNINNENKNS